MKMKMPAATHVLIGIAAAVVLTAVVGGLTVLRPPSEERARRLDDRRVEDLRGITRAVDLYWTRHGRLPTSLDELSRESGVDINAHDPSTTEPYDYRVLGEETYELCAHFQRDAAEPTHPADLNRRGQRQPAGADHERAEGKRVSKAFWSHGAGRQCYRPAVEEVLP